MVKQITLRKREVNREIWLRQCIFFASTACLRGTYFIWMERWKEIRLLQCICLQRQHVWQRRSIWGEIILDYFNELCLQGQHAWEERSLFGMKWKPKVLLSETCPRLEPGPCPYLFACLNKLRYRCYTFNITFNFLYWVWNESRLLQCICLNW